MRFRTLAVVLALLALATPALAQGDPDSRFHRANEAYEAGRYGEAAAHYEELLRLGVRDPRLEYNLGNARFKTGRVGEAILHWERARRIVPTDRDVVHNLRYARTVIVDRVEVPDPGVVVRAATAVQDRVGPGTHAWVALGLWWLTAGVVAWASSRRGGWTPRTGWVLAVTVVLLVAVAASGWFTWNRLGGREVAVVLAPAAEVRAGPGENNATLLTVHEGLTLDVRQVREGWIQVSLPDGLTGWIAAARVGRV